MARNPYYTGPVSDHFDGTRFFNPGQRRTDAGLGAVLRWKLAGGAARWPRSVPVVPTRPVGRVDDGMRVTMVGHAALLVQAAGINILTDPVWSDRASPFRRIGPRRVTAPGIAFDDLPPIDIVVLSHGHYDHCDVATLRRLHERDAPLMALPLGNDAIVRAAVPGARCVAGRIRPRLHLAHPLAQQSLVLLRVRLGHEHVL